MCDGIHHEACDLSVDENIIEMLKELMVGQCQDRCGGDPQCTWFTWFPVSGLLGNCWLLEHCEGFETCPECISGPGTGVDVDDC